MNIFITCKGSRQGTYSFVKPIKFLPYINHIMVFRDEVGVRETNIIYKSSKIKKPKILKFFLRFLSMNRLATPRVKAIVGIYEIPHGLIAFLVGKLLKRPSIICIIGNPAYKKIRKGFRWGVTLFIAKHCEAITTTGSKSKDYMVSTGINSSKIYVLPNSIDIEYFCPIKTEKRYDLISLGRLSSEKRIISFIQIIKEISRIKPEIKVAIAGKGPDKNKIKEKINDLGLKNNIDMVGFVKEHELVQFYNSGKVFILCSETEGFPRTVVESMACGVPCIASNVGDMEDSIKDGVNGYLINDYFDNNQFVEKALYLLNNFDIYEEFSRNSLIMARDKFSHKTASKVWDEIFHNIGVI